MTDNSASPLTASAPFEHYMSTAKGYRFKRLACDAPEHVDSCPRHTPWQLTPPGEFPEAVGWILHQEQCYSPQCFAAFAKGTPNHIDEHMEDLAKRVVNKRQGMCGW